MITWDDMEESELQEDADADMGLMSGSMNILIIRIS